jgi:hypothetical protein
LSDVALGSDAESRLQLVIELHVARIALERGELRVLLIEARHLGEAEVALGGGRRALDVLLEVFMAGGAVPVFDLG